MDNQNQTPADTLLNIIGYYSFSDYRYYDCKNPGDVIKKQSPEVREQLSKLKSDDISEYTYQIGYAIPYITTRKYDYEIVLSEKLRFDKFLRTKDRI